MAGQRILAPAYIPITGPLVFLAGPIQSARYWQEEAMESIQREDPQLHVASPRRGPTLAGDFDAEKYAAQVDWETHYLRRAAENGVILFWLACEQVHDPSRAYAQTSRFELGEWKARHERDDARLVVGIEEGFSGARYIRRRFAQDCPQVKICTSLEETCKAAVVLVSGRE